ncbi:MAG TPA: HlyD family type I secretion periplasmic adaptor subunit [Steroidobacteraceae bacterium]|jgi:HlyD family secretion protein
MIAIRSTRAKLAIGLVACAGIAGLAGSACLTCTSERAVVALGSVVVDTNPKKVRSPAGGTIAEIRVRDGDWVAAGAVVMRLDDAVSRSNAAYLAKSLDELSARESRLNAEQDDVDAISFPADPAARTKSADVAHVLAVEQKLFEARRRARCGEKEQLQQRIGRLEAEIAAYKIEADAKDGEIALVEEQLKGARDLRSKSLMPVTTLTSLEREAVRLRGERLGQLAATVAQAEGKIAETRFLIMQVDRDRRGEITRELRDTEAKIADVSERKVLAEDRLRRLEIRAPQDGVVHQPLVRAVGEEVAPGEDIVSITPRSNNLVVEAVFGSRDIRRLQVGQNVALQFSTPEPGRTQRVYGTLSRISPSKGPSEPPERSFYTASIAVPGAETERLGPVRPLAGTQAEVVVHTGASALSFLRPLGNRLAWAFSAI